jgi:hypothetical protein
VDAPGEPPELRFRRDRPGRQVPSVASSTSGVALLRRHPLIPANLSGCVWGTGLLNQIIEANGPRQRPALGTTMSGDGSRHEDATGDRSTGLSLI